MSTSKIGRAIKPRDVVTPGHSKQQEETSVESIKSELLKVEQLCKTLQEKYRQQNLELSNLNEKFNSLACIHKKKHSELVLVKNQLEQKNEQLRHIKSHVNDLEIKMNKLAAECRELRECLNPKNKQSDEVKSSWKLF
jgi:chromosome segregation ATPase